MLKISYSGMILLLDLIITAAETTLARKQKMYWWAVIGLLFVTYGIFDWHMGIIHAYKARKKKQKKLEETASVPATN